ncbi:hypothetical protein HMPREF0326_00251 [Desulfovibrio sp. 3_1_syn3]|uniref:hypothetical protein n=1 Tax=Desulfovibrio sp. 3_1_syn3 TaxID=457398 RepID=UPI0001E12811|nr:hypothetical protein [Desulfovibrio sp. 3_1_syn3]EFL86479.1 hypothetical protein HMPREF0326_00251 [Desulfovibrio sp. 3_1_syn3]
MLFSKTLARCLVLACALSISCAGVAFAAPQQGAAVKKPVKHAPKAAKPAAKQPVKAPETEE